MTARASDGPAARRPHVCLVVPNGSHAPDPLAVALASQHPDVDTSAIWCGDPHLRPVPGGVRWSDRELLDGSAAGVADWQRALVANPPLEAEWRRGLAATNALLLGGAPTVTLLWVGAIAVLADISTLWEPAGFVVVPRVVTPLPSDGAVPDTRALAAAGRFCTHVATFARESLDAVQWLCDRLDDDMVDMCDDERPDSLPRRGVGVARWLEVAAGLFDARVCRDDRVGVGAWRWDTDAPALLDVPGYDPSTPWALDPAVARRSRTTLVDHADRRRALERAADQLAGRRAPLQAPGGIEIDDALREIVRRDGGPVPSPWADPPAFRRWLSERYWSSLHATRRDLAVTFPRPRTDDAASFRSWTRRAAIDDRVALLVPPLAPVDATSTRFETTSEPRHDGLNLVGYLRRESSLGDVARRLAAALDDAHVPAVLLPHERTGSPETPDPPRTDRRVDFATTLAVVNADQFVTLEVDHPELVAATRRMIGYWFWELEHIPAPMRAIFPMVHEIWAGSQFVADAFAAVAPVPVRRVPIPVPQPAASDRDRSSFDTLAPFADRFLFGVVLDHFSVTERKNPVGAIEAFRRAFAPGEGPVLVVKTMNGSHRWPQHQQVRAAADGRPDIVVWDEHLSRVDAMAFIRELDVLVSLHRSEGLGLHLAEAMWLGTPTIATRYSGNLDFMDDGCATLIDASLVAVRGGEGVYPPEAMWADPDLDVAAAAMRQLATDRDRCDRLAVAGRAKMGAQPTLAQTGRLIADLLELGGG